jgi:hypothetical protein
MSWRYPITPEDEAHGGWLRPSFMRVARRNPGVEPKPSSVTIAKGTSWLVPCAVGLIVAGCGRADDARSVTNVTERFLAAVEQNDGARACARLSPGAIEAFEHDEGSSCAEAARGLTLEASRVSRAQVFATEAKVELADGESAFLELTSNGWRISAAGCTPQPDDQPYECEIEA